MIKLICPDCKRILADTDKLVDAHLKCRWCRGKSPVRAVNVLEQPDYLPKKLERKENK